MTKKIQVQKKFQDVYLKTIIDVGKCQAPKVLSECI